MKYKTIIVFLFSLLIPTCSVFAYIQLPSSFDVGGSNNPIYVQEVVNQNDVKRTANTQKENFLKSTYGVSEYYKCSSTYKSSCEIDVSDPYTQSSCLNLIKYCLESRMMASNFYKKTSNTVLTCQDGLIKKDNSCITYDKWCDMKYQNAIFGNFTNDGNFKCACKTGYVSSADSKSCIASVVVPTKTNDQICNEYILNSIWDGTKNDKGGLVCDCKTGYQFNNDQTQCISIPKTENVKSITNKTQVETKTIISSSTDDWKNPEYWASRTATTTPIKNKGWWTIFIGWFGFK